MFNEHTNAESLNFSSIATDQLGTTLATWMHKP